MIKKTTFGAMLAFLAVAGGALAGAALYLYRREKELDEYEKLLYTDDDYDDYDEDTVYEKLEDDEPTKEEKTEENSEDVKF